MAKQQEENEEPGIEPGEKAGAKFMDEGEAGFSLFKFSPSPDGQEIDPNMTREELLAEIVRINAAKAAEAARAAEEG